MGVLLLFEVRSGSISVPKFEQVGTEARSNCSRIHSLITTGSTMAVSKDWMFCPRSGYMLDLDGNKGVASCAVSGYKQDLQGAQRENAQRGWM